MGVLDRFERGIERAVNGAFARAFKSDVQPVEIASSLRRAMDDRAAVVGRGRTLVPNAFTVELGPADYARLAEYAEVLSDELVANVTEHAQAQRYVFAGPVRVAFEEHEGLDTGVFQVRSASIRAGAPPAAVTTSVGRTGRRAVRRRAGALAGPAGPLPGHGPADAVATGRRAVPDGGAAHARRSLPRGARASGAGPADRGPAAVAGRRRACLPPPRCGHDRRPR